MRTIQTATCGREATSLTTMSNPLRGEIWIVTFDPTIGAEIKKTRPAVVVSSDALGVLPVKLVAPITDWKNRYSTNIWHVQMLPTTTNGLDKLSAVDTLQIRTVDTRRFVRRVGRLPAGLMDEIAAAIAAVVEYI